MIIMFETVSKSQSFWLTPIAEIRLATKLVVRVCVCFHLSVCDLITYAERLTSCHDTLIAYYSERMSQPRSPTTDDLVPKEHVLVI